MQIIVGQSALSGEFSTYARRFGALEVSTEPHSTPRASRLERWQQEAPEGFEFSVVLPSAQMALHQQTPAADELKGALEAASRLKARWLLLRTPQQVRPDTRLKQRLASLIELLRGEEREIAWEPSGLWETRAAAALAAELGVVLVSDLTREDPAPGATLYTRLRRRARQAGPNQLLPLLERVLPAERCVVIVEGNGADQVQRWLRQELQFLSDSESASA